MQPLKTNKRNSFQIFTFLLVFPPRHLRGHMKKPLILHRFVVNDGIANRAQEHGYAFFNEDIEITASVIFVRVQ